MNAARVKTIADRLTRSITPKSFFKGGLVFAFLLVVAQAGYLFFVHSPSPRIVINDILPAVSSLAATLAIGYGAWWSSRFDRRLGSAWWLFMLGMAGWALGDLTWSYYELVVGTVPYPSIADVFYLSTYPFFFIGIMRFPRKPEASTRAVWLWMDIFIVMFSAVGIFWNFLIGPAVLSRQQPWLATVVNSAYPMGDLLLVFFITLIFFLPRSPLWSKPMYWILAGHSLAMLVDGIFTYQTASQTFSSSSFSNILFSIAPLVLMMSGLLQADLAHQVIKKQKTIPVHLQRNSLVILRLAIPFVWLLVAYILLHFNAGSKQIFSPRQFSLWVSAIIVLLAIRQILATVDNNRLAGELQKMNDELEERITDRSTELVQVNSELRSQMIERQRIEVMLREREEKLAHLALYDDLTSLPNRSLLIDRLSHAIFRFRRHKKDLYAVLFLDFDGFKIINDSLGHPAGDQLLIQIGQRLTSLVRAEDTVARFGGDEFVILVEEFQDENFSAVVAQRIMDALKEPFLLGKKPIYMTASIGVVLANPIYQTAIEIIRDADLAMYEAKTKGKARYVLFSQGMHLNAVNRLTLDSDLHKALELNEFVLQYQPIIFLETGRIAGFEALIRWRHPVRGLISPSEFIPTAEASGFIIPITHWTIQESCRQLSEWQTLFPLDLPLSISVNLSPISLRKPELFHWVVEGLRAASISANQLTLEIVETALIQDADLAKRTFTELRQLGVEVSLDDFGIGYSSLGYLNQYPIDILKIDRSLVNQVTKSKEMGGIVRTITKLAHVMNIKVVAEGIETQAQLKFMKKIGCQFGQGFFISRPLDPQVAQALLQQQYASGA